MLCGPTGCGKKALAIALGCELIKHSTSRPAAEASMFGMFDDAPASDELVPDANNMAMLAKLEHPDLHFTYPTIKTPSMGSEHQPISADFAREWNDLLMANGPYFSFNQWMEAIGAANQQAIITGGESDELSRKLSLKSSQGGYKVSIIWLPERMNATSANKLLKLLEEPPRRTVFIMVSEAPDQLLETIRSRTQRIDVKPISAEAIENQLFLDLFMQFMRLAYQRKVKELKVWSDSVSGFGREKQRRMLTYFLSQVRENFIYNFHNPELNYQTKDEEDFSRNFARFINEANVIEISEQLELAMRQIAQNANPRVVFFDLALQIIVLLIKK